MSRRFVEQLGQRVPAYELHADEVNAFRLAVVIRAEDIAVRDLAGQADLALEALQILRRARHHIARQRLDGHRFVELRVGGLVDDAHAAPA